jgi:hypothetical protein
MKSLAPNGNIIEMDITTNPLDGVELFIEAEKARKKDEVKVYEGVVLFDHSGDLTVLEVSDDCNLYDLFINGLNPDDNCVESSSFKGRPAGIYHVVFHPWSNETYDGDYDFGIDSGDIKLMYELPVVFLKH